jgi:hypothetical protein
LIGFKTNLGPRNTIIYLKQKHDVYIKSKTTDFIIRLCAAAYTNSARVSRTVAPVAAFCVAPPI